MFYVSHVCAVIDIYVRWHPKDAQYYWIQLCN